MPTRRRRKRRRRLAKWFDRAGKSKFAKFAKSKARGEAKRITNIVKSSNEKHILREVPIVKDIIKPITAVEDMIEDLPKGVKDIADKVIQNTPIIKDIAKPIQNLFETLF